MNSVDDGEAARSGGADWLSLALIDARNRTLAWLAAFEAQQAVDEALLDTVARAGTWQQQWIARCRSAAPLQADALRAWLAETLEDTLDRLAAAAPDALEPWRTALRHEDRTGERLAERAAQRQLREAGTPLEMPLPARPAREPLWFPPQRLQLGSARGPGVPPPERWAHEVPVPEFEIDALPVSWARFVEFAEDRGYDRRELWSEAGWAWLQAQARRAPRDVEQLRGGVLLQRGGRLVRVAAQQPVLHATRHEAEAWCRWAGRRLPTEPEWEAAALRGASRGFAWGDVFEWVAGSARAWPGHAPDPPALPDGAGALDDETPAPGLGVLRGASWMTRVRQRHPKARRFVSPESDTMFCGFRSCSP